MTSQSMTGGAGAAASEPSAAPQRSGLVLAALILVAAVANLNLAVANVALPDIGKDFDSTQTALNLIAVGYSLGLAASVLYLGALGDRYGRKLMLILGVVLAVPSSILAAYSPSDDVLFIARLFGGLSAGMAYPTTLALITALWAGSKRTRAIALWSGIGGAVAALGPMLSGLFLEHWWWGSVFLMTLPLAAVALVMAIIFVPSHVNETTESVDNIGGVLSIFFIGALVLAINFAPVSGEGLLVVVTAVIALVTGVAFFIRQRRAKNPLYDLTIARRRIFWVAAVAGIIVFGSLMGAMFIGQQYLQNVLEYSTFEAGAAILPAAAFMIVAAPISARLVGSRGSRFTLLSGYVFVLFGFITMLLLWKEDISYWQVALGYAFVGVGVGLAGTPASHSLTGSVPVKRAGMASGTADLQRDLGGAVMQSIFGALLAAGFSSSMSSAIAGDPNGSSIAEAGESELTKSFYSAEAIASKFPRYSDQILTAAREAFLDGDQYAYMAGIVAVVVGGILIFFLFPKKQQEEDLLARYHAEDTAADTDSNANAPQPESS